MNEKDELQTRPLLTGQVIHGDRRGRQLGFPTANLELIASITSPENGIYAGKATVGNQTYWAAISIGLRPTIGDRTKPIVEAYLLDFDGDLYDQTVSLELVHYLRPEQRFSSLKDLKIQIAADVQTVRKLAKTHS